MCQLWNKWLGSQNKTQTVPGSASKICESCWVVHNHNPSTQEVEARGLWVWGHLGLHAILTIKLGPCLKTTAKTKCLDFLVLRQVGVSQWYEWEICFGNESQITMTLAFFGMWPGLCHDMHILFVTSTGCTQELSGIGAVIVPIYRWKDWGWTVRDLPESLY